ncbi:MAG: HEPN domain-containing protein [Candidatus Desantisbacteria bacterium]
MDFDVEKTVQYWLNGAEYDRDVAGAMFQSTKYPYALFMGHLSIEKLMKALFVRYTKKHAPYIHSLPKLASMLSFEIPDEIKAKLDVFMEYYFQTRYPEEQIQFYKKCTKSYTEQALKDTEEVFEWLKKRL